MNNFEKEQINKMLAILGISIFFVFILPIILYMNSPHKNHFGNADDLVKKSTSQDEKVETTSNDADTNSVNDEKSNEENMRAKSIKQDRSDPFYSLILDKIEQQKRNPKIAIPYDYVPYDNYLKNAIDNTDGKIHVFKKNPIMIYVPKCEYYDAMTQAFVSYNYQFKGLLSFKATNDPKKSDIKIVLTNDFSADADGKGVIGLGAPKRFDSEGNIEYSEVKVLNQQLNGKDKVSMVQVYNVMLHEVGHAIGILGHSPNQNDLMYQSLKSTTSLANFSQRDVETIKLMYSNRNDLISSQLQNAQEEKLQENLAYAEKYQSSDSYLSVADSYYYAKQYDKALQAYSKALKLNPDNFRIYIKLTACYLVAKRYDDAITFGKSALKKAKTNEQIAGANQYIAIAYEEKKDYQSALGYRQNALNYYPQEKVYFMGYLYCCFRTDNKELAKAAYRKYIGNYDKSSFTEQEKLLTSWASGND